MQVRPNFPGVADATVVAVGDRKVGILGLNTPDTAQVSSPGPEVAFEAPEAAGARIAAVLKEQGADLVIALSHQDYTRDIALMRAVPAIDLVLGGHDHLALSYYDGRHEHGKATVRERGGQYG